MYFPFLMARGVEKNVIVNTIANRRLENVVPVITPYLGLGESLASNTNYIAIAEALVENEKRFITICRPNEAAELREKISNFDNFCIYGLYATDIDGLSQGYNFALIHDFPSPTTIDRDNITYHLFLPSALASFSYLEKFPHYKRVAIENAFSAQNRNADYPFESFFSSLFSIFRERFVGFGDYTVQSMDFEPASGSNMTFVSPAIHLSYVRDSSVFVRHYITTPAESPDFNTRVRFSMSKALMDKNIFFYSAGIRELEAKAALGATNLAKLKEIGMQHHIELMNNLIN
ncbi:sce7725 family protein [Geovibrio ferrireducens]|uniref:sce7725 family protein n=1 Tax=Geovibrio ferrireducens TaxID=46201 RepID=UPI002247C6B0|nr:sce7725 family protein [Geovibrio ferrireducens]